MKRKTDTRQKRLQFLVFLLSVFFSFSQNLSASDYYWVGGTGSWSNINHWAQSSGGTVLHNTPPTATDDVYFDANSFSATGQVVTVNAENAVCKSLDWTGALYQPSFENDGSENLRLFGSLKLIEEIGFNYDGTITFESAEAGNTISLAGHLILNHIYFEGIGGGWKLLGELYTESNIYFNRGTFETNDNTVSCANFYASNPNNRVLILGSSYIFVTGGWTLNGVNLDFQSGTSVIQVGYSLSNIESGTLSYNKVILTDLNSSVQNNSAYAFYDTLFFGQTGNVNGDCSINYLEFVNYGTVNDSDTINFVLFGGCGYNYISGNHIIDTAIFNCNGIISGQNTIQYCTLGDITRITDANHIGYLYAGDTAFVIGNNNIGHSFFRKMAYFRNGNTIEYAYLNCDGDFGGENVFDTLICTPGFQYIFEFDKTQTINDSLAIKGSCEKPIWIKSSYNGRRATISKTTGNVFGERLSLRDIEATGNTPFQALETVNLGNNVNWTIDALTPTDLYWVNGNGMWTDPNHWDNSSGGPGGKCPPTELDNVFFDGGSFTSPNQTVDINIRNAVCHNMDWTGASSPVLDGPDTTNLKIYGSLKLIQNMDFGFQGETHFEDTTGNQTIKSAKNLFSNNIRFQGTDGGWTLLDKISCTDTIFHDRGSLGTNGESIETDYFHVRDTCSKKLYLHTDTLIANGYEEAIEVDASNLDLHADSSMLITTSDMARIRNTNGERLVYHNVHQQGYFAQLINDAYCVFNVVVHDGDLSKIENDCTIDTTIFNGALSSVEGSDTIKTAIFNNAEGKIKGGSIVEIAYYFQSGTAFGSNKIDTALFYDLGKIEGTNFIDTAIIFKNAEIIGQNTIRTATLKDNGQFYGNNTFDDLTLTYAKKYFFEHDSTQTINENLIANGRCTGNIILMSDFDGKQASIKKTNGNVEIEYANLRDLKAEGNTPFIANSSVDLGNNEGWDILTAESIALYWVDDSGDWSDSLHWAPTSGGVGGYCIPSPIDDVYFDVNSFSNQGESVILDIENPSCRNMNWEGSSSYLPIFAGPPENGMYIYGSLLFNDSMNLLYEGETFFESQEEGKTINMKGKSFENDAVFRGRGGGWDFVNNFSTNKDLDFIYGKINTNDFKLNCRNFHSYDTTKRELLLGSSVIENGQSWIINTKNLELDADSSYIISGDSILTFHGDFSNQNMYKDTVAYNDVKLTGNANISNDSVYCYFDDVLFENFGSINGDCSIDTVIFENSGMINDNDSINHAWFKVGGTINGGHHVIKSALFDNSGTILGSNEVKSAIFNNSGNISGTNTIDTTIIYGNGSISGGNIFNSAVIIYGDGSVFGNNEIQNKLTIHGFASIFQQNEIHDALLLDWGNLGGPNNFDILTLSPGKTYTLSSSTTQTIDQRLSIRGNNCFPITLRSSIQNQQAEITMPSTADTISGDFIIMRDIQASGGAVYFAGGNSNNISNNSGWNWDDAPDYIYGLGFDTAYLCNGESLIITTDNFNPNETTTFEWGDGTVGPTYTVTEGGIYSVTANYSDNCAVPDQVYVEMLPPPEIDLGEDTEICEGEQLQIETPDDFEEYLWQDGTTKPSVTATNSGLYWLEVTAGNTCKARDSVYLDVLPSPHPYLGEDEIIHNDEFVILDAGYPGGSYFWSTNDTIQIIEAQGVEGGLEYWVEVYYDGCLGYDTIVIDEYPYCTADVPTAFSPNNDGTNDILFVKGSGIDTLDLKIFNRFGELVFETNEIDKGWDGTSFGEKQEEEVYIYYLKAICFDGLITEKKGNITLLR
ncbi:MAG: gliding motility-associated C-terminal domain-containing protein [Chlorobi bacterium]|nr:gliding motility-associated C-terminal domain-containing protein [Chlorobiota bacterium]